MTDKHPWGQPPAVKPRSKFLRLAERCGARITGKPDGSEPIEIVFSVQAWQKFDTVQAQLDEKNADRRTRLVMKELDRLSTSAYVSYIDQMSRTECLGWEFKVKHGQFWNDELKAHTRGGELLGKHRAFADALNIVSLLIREKKK